MSEVAIQESAQRDIVFVSLENWDAIWRRNQFICDELARRQPKRRILFVGLPRDLSHALRKRDWSRFASPSVTPTASRPNILLTNPSKYFPNSIAMGRLMNEYLFRRHIRNAMDRFDFNQPLLWLNAHSAVHLVGRLGERGVVYDITDDWTTLTQSQQLTQLIRSQDRQLCSQADGVIVCSERLWEMKAGMTRELRLIPNGVHAEHYLEKPDDSSSKVDLWKKPVVGYVGTIHPDRIDVRLVEAVARSMPEAMFVLVGPNYLAARDMACLAALPNVQVVGPVSYGEVPGYLHAFDVCMTPHLVTPFTESLNPIKLWEYLAVGKPIVSTNVAGFRDYPQFVSTASNATEFVDAIKRALCESPDVRLARQAEARRNSWVARVDEIERVLAEIEKGLAAQ